MTNIRCTCSYVVLSPIQSKVTKLKPIWKVLCVQVY